MALSSFSPVATSLRVIATEKNGIQMDCASVVANLGAAIAATIHTALELRMSR